MESEAGLKASEKPIRIGARGAFLGALGLAELFALDQLDVARLHAGIVVGGLPQAALGDDGFTSGSVFRNGVYFSFFCLLAFAVVSWPKRRELYASWARAARTQAWLPWLGLNAATFAILIFSAPAFATGGETSLVTFAAWCAGAMLMVLALMRAAAPALFWLQLAGARRLEILLALAAAASISGFALLSQGSWRALSFGTLTLSQWLLQAYETDVQVDMSQQMLGVGDFNVIISSHCSGYEGIGLVLGFLGLYVAMFREQFRFPQVLLVFPIGALAIWLANSVRIAALISIGAHWSPDVAIHGFHSHAGWIMFLAVAIGLMIFTHEFAFFRGSGSAAVAKRDPALRLASALLFPFVALMAGRTLADTFSAGGHWLYAIEVAIGCGVFWLYRDVYAGVIARVSPVSILVGALVGVVWIATDPGRGEASELGAWIAALPPAGAVGWLALRLVGSVALAPLAEEFAFRGYLHRALISRRFETVSLRRFTWLAFLASSLLFGVMHTRWLSAILAGMAYAITMYRTGRLSDPVAAHVASNAIIAAWAIGAQQYSLF